MPILYVVATPVGNLGDFSPRAIETLKNADLIAAEDTRVTGKLCQVFDIHTPLTSCHQHNENTKGEYLAERMEAENLTVALTTDAGTPCVSDPGYALVKACVDRGIEVQPIPGCCASIAALSVSGFDSREFAFYGFLPREKKDQREKLLQIAGSGIPVALIHESPFRIADLVENIMDTLPGAMLSLSCDLTKLHEKTVRGTPGEVLQALKDNPKAEKGEYCLVMELRGVKVPEQPAAAVQISLEARLTEAMREGMSLRDAQNELVLNGEKKNAVKQAALSLKRMFEEPDRK